MKNNVLFKASVIGAAAALSLAAVLGGCGKKTASQTGENIVPIEQPQDGTQAITETPKMRRSTRLSLMSAPQTPNTATVRTIFRLSIPFRAKK